MYKQKAQPCQKVYFLDNAYAETGGFLRDAYVIRCGVVTEVRIKLDHKFENKNAPGIVLQPYSFTSEEKYQVHNHFGMLTRDQVYTDLEQIRADARKMVQNNPGVTVSEEIEDILVITNESKITYQPRPGK